MPAAYSDDDGQDAEHALGAEDHAVGPEAPVARERAARDVLHRVGAERDHEADEQHLLAVEEPVGEPEGQEADDREAPSATRRGSAPAFAALRTTGPPPISRERRSATARPTSCSSGRKKPGRDDEHEDPEAVERGVLRLGEALEREDLEAVRGDARRSGGRGRRRRCLRGPAACERPR